MSPCNKWPLSTETSALKQTTTDSDNCVKTIRIYELSDAHCCDSENERKRAMSTRVEKNRDHVTLRDSRSASFLEKNCTRAFKTSLSVFPWRVKVIASGTFYKASAASGKLPDDKSELSCLAVECFERKTAGPVSGTACKSPLQLLYRGATRGSNT